MILGLAVLIELPTCDGRTDRQTKRQIYDDSTYRARISYCGKNGSQDPKHVPFRGDLSFIG